MTVAHQAPLAMEFCRQEYWSGLPFPSPGDLLNPGIEHKFPALQADSLPSEPPGKSMSTVYSQLREFKMGKQWLLIKHPGIWDTRDDCPAFPGSLENLIFIWWVKAFPGCKIDALTMKKKMVKNKYAFTWSMPPTISSDQDTHLTGQIIPALTKTSQTSWNYHSHCHP